MSLLTHPNDVFEPITVKEKIFSLVRKTVDAVRIFHTMKGKEMAKMELCSMV